MFLKPDWFIMLAFKRERDRLKILFIQGRKKRDGGTKLFCDLLQSNVSENSTCLLSCLYICTCGLYFQFFKVYSLLIYVNHIYIYFQKQAGLSLVSYELMALRQAGFR